MHPGPPLELAGEQQRHDALTLLRAQRHRSARVFDELGDLLADAVEAAERTVRSTTTA